MIQYGNFVFTEPQPILAWTPIQAGGIYAIQVMDRTVGPRPFVPIYFGQAKNLRDRLDLTQHHAFEKWIAVGRQASGLYLSLHFEASAEQRDWIEYQLISQYAPVCNERLNPLNALSGIPVRR